MIYINGPFIESNLTKGPKLGTLLTMADKQRELNEYRAAIEILKRALKRRGLTYREIAKGIGLSESGVKKIFLASDGSFQRIAAICRYVGLSLAEIVEDRRTVAVGFSEKQQKAFLKDPALFHFYWLLVYERRSLQQAQDDLNLSKAEAFRLARKLDVLDLIKLLPGDRLRIPSIKAVRWTGDGEFIRTIYRNWSRSLIERIAKPENEEGDLFLLRYLQMTHKTYGEFLAALSALENEFVRRSIQEMRTQPAALGHVRWLVASDNRSFVTGLPSPDARA